jgi:hypothetical protein
MRPVNASWWEQVNSRSAHGVETLGGTQHARARWENGDSLRKTDPLPGILRAELVACGKPACRCARGQLHGPYLYRRWREGGRQQRQYVRPADLQQVRAALAEWKHLHPPVYRVRQQLTEFRRLLRQLDRWEA